MEIFKYYKNNQEWCNKHRYDYRIFNTETPLKLVSLYNV